MANRQVEGEYWRATQSLVKLIEIGFCDGPFERECLVPSMGCLWIDAFEAALKLHFLFGGIRCVVKVEAPGVLHDN